MHWLIAGRTALGIARAKGTHDVSSLHPSALSDFGGLQFPYRLFLLGGLPVFWQSQTLICFHLSHLQGNRPSFQFTLVDRSWVISDWLGLGHLSISHSISVARRGGVLICQSCVTCLQSCARVEHCD